MIISGRFASENDVRRFYLEAESAANLDHAGIVPIYEIGEVDGNHFFSMKLIEGGSLADHMPELRSDQRAAADLIAQIARAVHHAHQRGILHRDIKPGNILLDTDGSPLVSDLGLAKDTTNDSGLTHTGAVVGTPGYMAPEQASGSDEITTAVDIYAIGAILYEAMTGRPPHKGSTVIETLRKVVEEEPALPRSLNGKINRTLQLICMKCLRKDPNQRYESAAALAQDLENWLAGESVSVRPPSWTSTLGEIIMLNLRSALGAAFIGIVAGWCAGYCLANLSISNNVLQNPPAQIYAEIGKQAPLGMSLIPVNTDAVSVNSQHRNVAQGWCIVGLYFAIVMVGIVVACVTRPRTGNSAFAIGAVSALLMTFVFFVQTLFMNVQSTLHDTSSADLAALASVAVADDEHLEESRNALMKRFPKLANVAVEKQAATLANYLHYQTVFAVPIPILVGVGIASIFCLVPCTFGTTYTAKLIQQKQPWWMWVPRSLEFGYVTTITCAMVFLISILGMIPDSKGPFELSLGRQVFFYACMLILMIGIYRQKLRWYWRIVVYVVFWLGMIASG